MAIKKIEELKEIWVNGYKPTEKDFADVFDTIESLKAKESPSFKILGEEVISLSTTINASKLNGDKKNKGIELIAGKPNTFIILHAYAIALELNAPATTDKGFPQANLSYNANDGSEDVVIENIPLQAVGKNIIVSTSHKHRKYAFSNNNETPIGKSVVFKGTDGVIISGMKGKLQIKIDYSYLPFEL